MEERTWMVHVDRLTELVLDTVYAVVSSLPCGSGSAQVQINEKWYEIVKLLGEGGFSLVYLIRDPASGQQYALKKIRCQNGEVSVREALAEVDAMRRFRGPNVIRVCDAAVVRDDVRASVRGNIPAHDEESGQGQIVYIVLPYFANGNLQDAINAHVIHGSRYEEMTMLHLFLGACRGVQTMHNYALPEVKVDHNDMKDQEESLLFDAESDAAYPPAPLMRASNLSERGDELAREAYAHRDIKPAYV